LESDHRNAEKSQQEETPSQREREREREREDVSSTALKKKKRNDDTPLCYSGRTALRREQCDEMPESGNREVIS
jgi:hypothetical protein